MSSATSTLIVILPGIVVRKFYYSKEYSSQYTSNFFLVIILFIYIQYNSSHFSYRYS
jgi:hypothetical protein